MVPPLELGLRWFRVPGQRRLGPWHARIKEYWALFQELHVAVAMKRVY